jgi:hypothetical protein
MSNTLMGTLQQAIRNTFGCANDFNGDLHVLADYWGIPMSPISGRTIDVARKYDTSITSASPALNYLLQNGANVVPGLALNFVSGNTLDPRITFSRTSNATQFDSSGNLVYAPHNLLRFSESFDNSQWGKVAGTTVSANSTTAPNGTSTADKYIENATSGGKIISNGEVLSSGVACVLSVYAKAGERTAIAILAGNTGFGNSTSVVFDLTNGTFSTGIGSPSGAFMTPVGDGWYRCGFTTTTVASAQGDIAIYLMNAPDWASRNYTGDGTSGLFLWGAQLNVGTLQPYYPTTVKNLLGYTQEFDNAGWTKSNATVTANATAAPDGSLTADKLVENTAASVHSATQASAAILKASRVAFSVYAKAAERSTMRLRCNGYSGNAFAADFNLSTGVATPVGNAGTAVLSLSSMTPVGDGWYRCAIAGTTAAAGTGADFDIFIQASSYTGDGTSGIFLWGAQLSDSASLDEYRYNPVAAPASTAYYGPRFDYDPVTLSARGLLIEEQRVNSIRNNTMVGAVAGTPGTLPTNWVVGSAAGLTTNVIGTGTESGVAYVDVQVVGTPTGTAYTLFCDGSTQIAALNAQTWTSSLWCKITAGATTNITSINNNITFRDSGGAALQSLRTAMTLSSTLARFSQAQTASNASTAFVHSGVWFTVTVGSAIDITLRIGLPQLELGAFATSVIPTTTAAATRTADVATMVGANFSNWYNAAAGTLYADFATSAADPNNNRGIVAVDDNTNNNRVALFVPLGASPIRVSSRVVSGGVATNPADSATVSVPAAIKAATTYGVGTAQAALTVNGATPSTASPTASPVGVNTLRVGSIFGVTQIGGHLRRISYYPRRLADSELQAITQ